MNANTFLTMQESALRMERSRYRQTDWPDATRSLSLYVHELQDAARRPLRECDVLTIANLLPQIAALAQRLSEEVAEPLLGQLRAEAFRPHPAAAAAIREDPPRP